MMVTETKTALDQDVVRSGRIYQTVFSWIYTYLLETRFTISRNTDLTQSHSKDVSGSSTGLSGNVVIGGHV